MLPNDRFQEMTQAKTHYQDVLGRCEEATVLNRLKSTNSTLYILFMSNSSI